MAQQDAPAGAAPREGSGLVNSPLPSPMLQPWEVWDQDLFDTEMLRVFGRSWVWLGDTEDLRSPGDYITARIGYQPVLVIRQADGTVAGFLNNCRHRASGLLSEPAGNCGSTLTCPYHNWSYSIDGRLLRVPDIGRMYPEGLPLEEYGLVPFRVEVAWGKLVFGCLSQRTEPFGEWIAPLAERYDRYGFENFNRYHRQLDVTYDINWKAFVENSNDDYHVRFVHRRLNRYRKQMDTIVRFSGPDVQRLQAPFGDRRRHRRPRRPVRRAAARPLRRLHLPQPHAAALSHAAHPGARRPHRSGPHPAAVTHLRRR